MSIIDPECHDCCCHSLQVVRNCFWLFTDEQIVVGHQDFEYTLPGNVRLSFVWAPYAVNITTILSNWYTQTLHCCNKLLLL